jgi:hypothetical protein
MIETFEQILDSSRTNSWSWGYPIAVWSGVGVLLALSLIRHAWLRRAAKVIAILGLSFLATAFAGEEIQEKWMIRGAWADAHPDQMTSADIEALTADGANLLLGPVIYGLAAFGLYVIVAIALSMVRFVATRFRRTARASSEGDSNDLGSTPSPTVASDNPYHPPVS